MKNKLYDLLVMRNYIIRSKYNSCKYGQLGKYFYLIWLNLKYNRFTNDMAFHIQDMIVYDENAIEDINPNDFVFPESIKLTNLKTINRQRPEIPARKLIEYDIVSFDIFDTLVLRPFLLPEDLFDILEIKLGIKGFRKIRIDAQKEAQKITEKPDRRINIEDIYAVIEKRTGLDKEIGIQLEVDTEIEYCYANPYFKRIYETLLFNNIKMIAVSDMYLPEKYIKQILDKCGYDKLSKIFVSCDYFCGKHNGHLQQVVKNKYTHHADVIHLGDNYRADVEGSRKMGWDAIHYTNVQKVAGRQNLLNDRLDNSIYRGLTNAYLYNGVNKNINPAFEIGYLYTGILCYGFCQYIDEVVQQTKSEKILFALRDMDIVHTVYTKYFDKYPSEKIFCSRFSAYQLSFEKWTEEFINTICKVISEPEVDMDIVTFLENYDLKILYPKITKYNIKDKKGLTIKEIPKIRKMIYDNKDLITKHFELSKYEAIEYYKNVIGDSEKITIVDIGWSGASLFALSDFIKDNIASNIEINIVLVAARKNDFSNMSNQTNNLFTYLFSPNKNLNLFTRFSKNTALKIIVFELLFTSNIPTLVSFYDYKNDKKMMRFGIPEISNNNFNKENQLGTLNFIEEFHKRVKGIGVKVNPETPSLQLLNLIESNTNEILSTFKNMEFFYASGTEELGTLDLLIKEEIL